MAERKLASYLASAYKGSNSIHEGLLLRPNYQSKSSSSNTIMLGLEFQHMNLGSRNFLKNSVVEI